MKPDGNEGRLCTHDAAMEREGGLGKKTDGFGGTLDSLVHPCLLSHDISSESHVDASPCNSKKARSNRVCE